MNYKSGLYAFLFLLLAASALSCTGNKSEKKPETLKVTKVAPVIGQETILLLKDLEENGDYVNSQFFPSLN